MPRYDYKCDVCSHRFDERQSFDSEPVAECPACHGRSSRQFVAVPVVFKCSGFYVNDYGKKSSTTQTNNSSSESEGSSDASDSSKSESKSDDSSAAKDNTSAKPATNSSKDD